MSEKEKERLERVGQLLAVAAGAARTLAAERLEPLGLSPRSWAVLSTLVESGPLAQIELATATGTDRTAMVYLLDELERRKLVQRRRKPGDRRSYLVSLTPRGERAQRTASDELAEQASVLLAPLAAGERRRLVELLARVVDRWEASESATPAARPARALRALEEGAEPARRPFGTPRRAVNRARAVPPEPPPDRSGA